MNDNKFEFPKIKRAIYDFIDDEDGNITRGKLVTIGAMVLIMSIMSGMEAFAAHGSHKSHGSHSSHSSTSYVRDHSNHASHSDHGSHASHASHTSHSNTVSHSNSLYSIEGDVTYGPSISSIKGVSGLPLSNATFAATTATTNIDIIMPEVPNTPWVPDTMQIQKVQDVDLQGYIIN